jgi:CheY-like chemotaxis protein
MSEPPATPAPSYVFVVDDDPAVLDVLTQLVQSYRWTAIPAHNGIEALLRFQNYGPTNFSHAVTDLMMPKMDGSTLVQMLKQLHPGLITLLCTAVPDVLLGHQKYSDFGFDGLIVKPFTIQMFHRKLSEFFEMPPLPGA